MTGKVYYVPTGAGSIEDSNLPLFFGWFCHPARTSSGMPISCQRRQQKIMIGEPNVNVLPENVRFNSYTEIFNGGGRKYETVFSHVVSVLVRVFLHTDAIFGKCR